MLFDIFCIKIKLDFISFQFWILFCNQDKLVWFRRLIFMLRTSFDLKIRWFLAHNEPCSNVKLKIKFEHFACKELYTWMFRVVFIAAKKWKQPKCPSANKCINKIWCIQHVPLPEQLAAAMSVNWRDIWSDQTGNAAAMIDVLHLLHQGASPAHRRLPHSLPGTR